MTNYDLTSIGAVSASAKLAHIRANQEPDQSSYNARMAPWLRRRPDQCGRCPGTPEGTYGLYHWLHGRAV